MNLLIFLYVIATGVDPFKLGIFFSSSLHKYFVCLCDGQMANMTTIMNLLPTEVIYNLLYFSNSVYEHMFILIAVISEPDDVAVCEGRLTTFTCVLNSSISSDDVQWYRLIMDTSTTVMVDPQDSNIHFTTSTINNTLTSSLTITNAVKSYTGYYWVRLPSDDVCNVSLTVGISTWMQFIMCTYTCYMCSYICIT